MNNIDIKIIKTGIITEILYFITVSLFIITKQEWALTLWETMTVVGAIIILVVLIEITDKVNMKNIYRTLILIFTSGTLFITSIAHFTSIGVIRLLESQGQLIPNYFKIGYWPSLEMTLDYTAWGFFMGFTFLFLGLGIKNKILKIISIICSILCFIGFIGTFFKEYLWYAAPLGYGLGFLIICIIILYKKNTD